eukprot:m51a1_g9308 hypothetical protein (1308) ;mRNA; r:87685-93403
MNKRDFSKNCWYACDEDAGFPCSTRPDCSYAPLPSSESSEGSACSWPDWKASATGDGCVRACGDGAVDMDRGETCDDANREPHDGCGPLCTVETGYACAGQPSLCRRTGSLRSRRSTCGNKVVEPPETCDDGNTVSGDGCSSLCTIEDGFVCTQTTCTPICGDGEVHGSESCDDNNTESGDGCSSSCQVEPGWHCTGEPSECVERCGDSVTTPSEECDDGNTASGDGCSSKCVIEPGYSCNTAPHPSVCALTCGDGVVSPPGEECDDGNRAAGDGCSASCAVESGWSCSGNRSVCVRLPVITSAGGAPTAGGSLTISGLYLSGTSVSVTADGSNCPVTSHTSTEVVCTVGAGTGANHALVLTVGSFVARSTWSYASPGVSSATSPKMTGGLVTISGSNFGARSSKVSVVLGSVACTGVSMTAAHTTLTCMAPAGRGCVINVTVTVDGLSSGASGIGAFCYDYSVTANQQVSVKNATIAVAVVTVTAQQKQRGATVVFNSSVDKGASIVLVIPGNNQLPPNVTIDVEEVDVWYFVISHGRAVSTSRRSPAGLMQLDAKAWSGGSAVGGVKGLGVKVAITGVTGALTASLRLCASLTSSLYTPPAYNVSDVAVFDEASQEFYVANSSTANTTTGPDGDMLCADMNSSGTFFPALRQQYPEDAAVSVPGTAAAGVPSWVAPVAAVAGIAVISAAVVVAAVVAVRLRKRRRQQAAESPEVQAPQESRAGPAEAEHRPEEGSEHQEKQPEGPAPAEGAQKEVKTEEAPQTLKSPVKYHDKAQEEPMKIADTVGRGTMSGSAQERRRSWSRGRRSRPSFALADVPHRPDSEVKPKAKEPEDVVSDTEVEARKPKPKRFGSKRKGRVAPANVPANEPVSVKLPGLPVRVSQERIEPTPDDLLADQPQHLSKKPRAEAAAATAGRRGPPAVSRGRVFPSEGEKLAFMAESPKGAAEENQEQPSLEVPVVATSADARRKSVVVAEPAKNFGQPLPYRAVHCTSQDPKYPMSALESIDVHAGRTGWASQAACKYPQSLVLDLGAVRTLRGLEIMSHQFMIASRVDVLVSRGAGSAGAAPAQRGTRPHWGSAPFELAGFFSLSDNRNSGLAARELKTVRVDPMSAMFVKLVFRGCHKNSRNNDSQVSVVGLTLWGDFEEQRPEDEARPPGEVPEQDERDPTGSDVIGSEVKALAMLYAAAARAEAAGNAVEASRYNRAAARVQLATSAIGEGEVAKARAEAMGDEVLATQLEKEIEKLRAGIVEEVHLAAPEKAGEAAPVPVADVQGAVGKSKTSLDAALAGHEKTKSFVKKQLAAWQ